MISMNHFLYSLIVCLLIQKVFPQEVSELSEEYIDEELPESADGLDGAPVDKPSNKSNDAVHKKTNFTEDRFTKLFQPRRRPPGPSPLLPKYIDKVKPTLPPFIKRAPPIIKAQPTTTSPQQQQRFNQRSVSTTQRTTTTRSPLGSRGSLSNNRRNQISNSRGNTQTTASPSTTTDSSSRRRFGSGNRRFNTNSTIPATSRPKRS